MATTTATASTNFSMVALISGLLSFQKSRIKRARQQLAHVKDFALPGEIRENDLRAARKLPDDLPASATRRRQRFRIRNYRQLRKLSFTFRQRFPDRDALRTHRQAITRALDVAPGVNLPTAGAHRRANEKT